MRFHNSPRTIVRALVTSAALPILLGLATTKCTGASGFCDDFCKAYTDCTDSGKYADADRPLFCGLREPTRQRECVSACQASVDRLGESQGAFSSCANCAVSYLDGVACSDSESEEIAKTSCSSSCGSSAAGRGADAFRKSFHAQFDKADEKSCSRTGTVSYAADDSKIGHKVGAASGSGGWKCTSGCSYSHIMYGPYVGLPAGTYEAGFRGVQVGGTIPSDALFLDVVCNNGDTLAERTITKNEVTSQLSATFTVAETKTGCEVRLLVLGSDTTASVASAYFTRR